MLRGVGVRANHSAFGAETPDMLRVMAVCHGSVPPILQVLAVVWGSALRILPFLQALRRSIRRVLPVLTAIWADTAGAGSMSMICCTGTILRCPMAYTDQPMLYHGTIGQPMGDPNGKSTG